MAHAYMGNIYVAAGLHELRFFIVDSIHVNLKVVTQELMKGENLSKKQNDHMKDSCSMLDIYITSSGR